MSLNLDPSISRQLITRVREASESYAGAGVVVLLAPPLARGPLRRLLEKVMPRLPVISPAELLPTVKLDRVAVVDVVVHQAPQPSA
jgi:flagellar biosynthesis component FlhA